MYSDSRVSYWLKARATQNFGDMLSEILFHALTKRSIFSKSQGRLQQEYDVVHLIGSCISDWQIEKDLEHVRADAGRRIAFWGCGLRSAEPPRPDLMAHCDVLGVRGPLTRDALGLPKTSPIGDPGLLLPYLYTPRKSEEVANQAICVPHFLESKSDEELLAMSRCQLILRPNLPGNIDSVFNFVDILVSAKFVLAGALHAAIVAHAYGRPFAYFDSGYVDVPFKWDDFGASIDMPVHFVKTADDGLAHHEQTSHRYKMPPLANLLHCAPYKPSKRLLSVAAAGSRWLGFTV